MCGCGGAAKRAQQVKHELLVGGIEAELHGRAALQGAALADFAMGV